MAKFYVISDIHGFYDEMIEALDKTGFDKNNPEHWLITCGDNFDRGSQPLQVMEYLQSLPRKILVKGNHESLILDCILRCCPLSYDWYNGTARTIVDLAPNAKTFDAACMMVYEKMKNFIDSMVDYVELKNHIFVHSWIPLISQNEMFFKFKKNWREAHYREWENARWGNPFELAEKGLLPDKTIVFGHFHTSYARSRYEDKPEWGEDADFSIYYGDGYIAIDGCTAYSRKVNVLVIEDEFLEDKI